MPAKLGLLEDGGAVAHDFKASPAGWRQCDDRTWKRRTNLGRQTGGPGFVISKRTVFDAYTHGVPIGSAPPMPPSASGRTRVRLRHPREPRSFGRCRDESMERLESRRLNQKDKRSQPLLGALTTTIGPRYASRAESPVQRALPRYLHPRKVRQRPNHRVLTRENELE